MCLILPSPLRPYAKPLIVMSPKWLYLHKACTSNLADMALGTFFHRVIVEGGQGDNMVNRRRRGQQAKGKDGESEGVGAADALSGDSLSTNEDIRRVIFCAGKVTMANINYRLLYLLNLPTDILSIVSRKEHGADPKRYLCASGTNCSFPI